MEKMIKFVFMFTLCILAFAAFVFGSMQRSKIDPKKYINQITFKKEKYQVTELGLLKAELKPNYLLAIVYGLVMLVLLFFFQVAFFSDELIFRIIISIVLLGAGLWNLRGYTCSIGAYDDGFVIKTVFTRQELYYKDIESLNLYLVNGWFTRAKYFGYMIKINGKKSIQFDSRSYKKIEDFINMLIQDNPHIEFIY